MNQRIRYDGSSADEEQPNKSKARPVLISVSQGSSAAAESEVSHAHPPIHATDSFDPFGIAQLQQQSSKAVPFIKPPPNVSRLSRPNHKILPPKMMIKLTIHEQVSSVAKTGKEREGTSEVTIDGTIYAQVQCSDANRNAPFSLKTGALSSGTLTLYPNQDFSASPTKCDAIEVPKKDVGYVPVAFYTITDEIEHMPVLLERKVTVQDKSVRIAIQVRSKLSNLGKMEDFSIALAIPERVDGSSVEVVRGEGHYDELKRTVIWKLSSLNKGESFMVSAHANLWTVLGPEEDVQFPVILRCSSSADHISSLDVQVTECAEHPASLTTQKVHSFQLLHRLT
jgi:hypothetical protein